jgi:acetyl esterase/lipase
MRHGRRLPSWLAAIGCAVLASGCLVPEAQPGETLPAGVGPRAPDVAALAYRADPTQLLDIYLPPASFTGPRPLIVYVHGGAWIYPGRDDIGCVDAPECVPALASQIDRGYVVASIDYRLAQEADFPAPVADVKLAIDWLRDHAASYRIDPGRVVVAGHSAGGHLAALAALTPGQWEPPGVSATQVDGFVDLVGPSDVAAWAAWGDEPGAGRPTWIADTVELLVDCTYTDPACTGPLAAASPLSWVDASDPRGYLVCKDTDPFVPCSQLVALHDALVDAKDDPLAAFIDDVNCSSPSRPPCSDTSDLERHNPDWDLNLVALQTFLDEVTA